MPSHTGSDVSNSILGQREHRRLISAGSPSGRGNTPHLPRDCPVREKQIEKGRWAERDRGWEKRVRRSQREHREGRIGKESSTLSLCRVLGGTACLQSDTYQLLGCLGKCYFTVVYFTQIKHACVSDRKSQRQWHGEQERYRRAVRQIGRLMSAGTADHLLKNVLA